jgi:hypothetical protein
LLCTTEKAFQSLLRKDLEERWLLIPGKKRVQPTLETAFSYRDAKWSMVIVGVDPDPANAEKITTCTKDYWAALHPYSLCGAYVNFMMEEGIDRVRATYRNNYDRLVEIKRKYDPDNFFHVNQNIRLQ